MLTSLFCLLLLSPQLVDRTNELKQPPPAQAELSHERRADIYMARKMYREGVDEYKLAIAERPKSARLYNKLGISYHHQLMFRDAKKCYERSAKLDKKFAQAINNLGTVYYARRNYKKAQKQYGKALKITPYSASVYSNLGTALFARKKYKQATVAYLQALRLDPYVFEHRNEVGTLLQDRSVADRAKYHYFLAQAYAQAGIFDRAVLYLRRSIEEGYGKPKRILKDDAFQAMAELPEFLALVDPNYKPPVEPAGPETAAATVSSQ